MIANPGMDRIGEIERGRALRQRDQRALRREGEHVIGVHFELGVLEEFLVAAAMFGDLQKRARRFARIQAHRGCLLFVKAVGFVLVAPVRGDAELGQLVHLFGADLDLDPHVAGPDHGGVDRAIAVRLGIGDVIFQLIGHAAPGLVDQAERAIAIVGIVHDDAEGVDVGEVGEFDALALQLAPDRIGLFLAAIDARVDAGELEHLGDGLRDVGDVGAFFHPQLFEPRVDGGFGLRKSFVEGEAFQFPRHALHAHAARERTVDLQRLHRDAPALFRAGNVRERAHVVQPVSQLHDQHAHVLGHGQDEFLQVLRLLALFGLHLELG